MNPASTLRPWEYPDCPNCNGHAFVQGNRVGQTGHDWYCNLCSLRFDENGDAELGGN